MKVDEIERRSLKVTIVASLIMAIAGWYTYYLTGSEAMFLDGNFSLITAVSTSIAVLISQRKHKKTTTFPFGSYVYEAAFVLSKGLLLLGIIITALVQNLVKIIAFFQGEIIEPVIMTPIYFYSVFILVLTFLLLCFFKYQNRSVNYQSSILLVEAESARIDGVLTFSTGLAFFLLSFINVGSKLEFLLYIGDSIIVILLSLLIITKPIKIIKNAFIELSGGTIQDQNEKLKIEATIDEIIQGRIQFNTYITKVGSGYFVVIYVEPKIKTLNFDEFRIIQQQIKVKLRSNFPTVLVEISLKDQS